ncbi:sugar transferase [Tessaracoccus oleiagri]|uniref:Undecaprenyl-phosphate galactose phosphotransferase, WbaP/exopolysaccharide biosynthesis polyprenyl glycosylphosphotransferase n=1 Tax=Tessaracoccus oleiagri TaxID=686624 RepID=A0A1G9MU93_9ACTN|nr:sugar transferase [Tessaracoccus oleiagri]SDL77693.1 Undecaprenyl-phosphate galactose phosphotransferase, WbaP/exopolysaccharide biosynthesis polyprenyl glycosylphosphotransferase [Tessaracoccus oleiagri]
MTDLTAPERALTLSGLAKPTVAAAETWSRWSFSARTQHAILIAIDAVVIIAALGVTLAWGWSRDLIHLTAEHVLVTAGMLVGWIVLLGLTGAYSLRHLRAGPVEYRRVANASVVAAGIFGVSCYLLNYSYPRTMFGVWVVVGLFGLLLFRLARRRVMHGLHRRELLLTPVLMVGSVAHVDEVAMVLSRERWMGYKIVGAITREETTSTGTGLRVLGGLSDLKSVIEQHKVSVAIFTEGSFDCPGDFRRLAWKLEQSRIQLLVVPTLADISPDRLEFRPFGGLPLVDVARPRALRSLRWSKRVSDVVASAILLVLALPILLVTALLVKLEDGGPVLFRQRRVGLKGQEFDCLKFRSMCVDAEARLAALQAQNQGAGVLFKMVDDPRITKVGKFIRRYSIDELPQLWNALRGDMSLVGPRPALPREVAQYDSDTRRRLEVRPGLTGLWQVSGRSTLSWEDTVRLDLYYVDNWSIIQDVIILLKTFRAVVGSSGAY